MCPDHGSVEEFKKLEARPLPQPKVMPHDGRKYSWATERIHELQADIEELKKLLAARDSLLAEKDSNIHELERLLEEVSHFRAQSTMFLPWSALNESDALLVYRCPFRLRRPRKKGVQ